MANIGYIQLTRECNQECRFCSNPPNAFILDFDEAIKILDGFKMNNFEGVIFTGGEPTLYTRINELIEYSKKIGLHSRIITNGQKLSDKSYFNLLIKSGLNHIHVSIHSYKEDIQGFLTNNKDSLSNIKRLLYYSKELNISIDINTVINKYNSDHLHENVEWIVKNYPNIKHFVWNNLDPHMKRVEKNPDVIPRFQDFEISLYKSCKYLKENNKTFRIERVPLCYMAEFAECSTETRKIVKDEERVVYFLDEKGKVIQDYFFYKKAPVCDECFINTICSGIYEGNKFFSFEEIYPVFVDKNDIIKKIKKG